MDWLTMFPIWHKLDGWALSLLTLDEAGCRSRLPVCAPARQCERRRSARQQQCAVGRVDGRRQRIAEALVVAAWTAAAGVLLKYCK